MRLILVAPTLIALAALAACGGTPSDSAEVCAEQAAMAQAGTADGGQITITCP
ncbi:hypothetical protein LHP98_10325 [Rhodobacter sp. Har01]|uniref:hypothetical protein n=1 Tax=Rhodobacter sp. Har01 TaxID=2883999 RepID=UPI001D06B424|nr:hypothetical protein [Rhodobacter sp. Har01]MCB6178527.1 hypothetical protein [Rhodobacter sp. Har01]